MSSSDALEANDPDRLAEIPVDPTIEFTHKHQIQPSRT